MYQQLLTLLFSFIFNRSMLKSPAITTSLFDLHKEFSVRINGGLIMSY